MRNISIIVLILVSIVACEQRPPTSDSMQKVQQEQILKEATAQVGMPSIKNFRERKIMKDILEMRDHEGIATYTYTYSEQTGKRRFLCNSVGFPIPYATQYTNPQKVEYITNHGMYILPQADPNSLFSPSSAEGTWIMCKDPKSDKVAPVYSEPKVQTFLWKMDSDS